MRTYDRMDFLPCQECPDNMYNTFKGFRVENTPLIKTDIENSKIWYHIKNIISNGDDKIFEYFINWLARMVQKPYDNSNKTACLFKSDEGSGKDTILNWMGENIIGSSYYLNEDKLKLMFGQFNSELENKILVVLNEPTGKDTAPFYETIKNAISRKTNKIEHKGLKAYDNKNHIHFCLLTNNEASIKISTSDRRFFATECNNTLCNNNEYFNALYAEIESGEYDRAFYDYFMSLS